MEKMIGLKEEIDNITIIAGDLRTTFSIIERIARQNNKETEELNNIINQLDVTDIYRTLYSKTEYTFFSKAHGILSG